MRFIALFLLSFGLASSTKLSVQGNLIKDATGTTILLRGIAVSGFEFNCGANGQHTFAQSDYELMKSWGANVVRIPLSQCCWLDNTNNYKSLINQQISWITSLSMYAIIDLHWSKGSQSGCVGQRAMPDADSVNFWDDVSVVHGSDPNVIFELYNEPFPASADIWLNGGSVTNDGTFTAVGMQTLYNTVRTHSTNVVIINGMNYGYQLTQVIDNSHKVTGDNIIYGSHIYQYDGKRTHQEWDANFGSLTANYPVIATEFGTNQDSPCNSTYYYDLLDYFNTTSHHMSWLGWAWFYDPAKTYCQYPFMIDNFNGNPTVYGQIVKDALQHPQVPLAPSVTSSSPPPTPTTAAPPTPCSNQVYDACGGSGTYFTSSCCPSGSYCNCTTVYYHQCIPGTPPSGYSCSSTPVPPPPTPTPTPTTGGTCVAQFNQCGGINYAGPTNCCSGTTCTQQVSSGTPNQYYWQCL